MFYMIFNVLAFNLVKIEISFRILTQNCYFWNYLKLIKYK